MRFVIFFIIILTIPSIYAADYDFRLIDSVRLSDFRNYISHQILYFNNDQYTDIMIVYSNGYFIYDFQDHVVLDSMTLPADSLFEMARAINLDMDSEMEILIKKYGKLYKKENIPDAFRPIDVQLSRYSVNTLLDLFNWKVYEQSRKTKTGKAYGLNNRLVTEMGYFIGSHDSTIQLIQIDKNALYLYCLDANAMNTGIFADIQEDSVKILSDYLNLYSPPTTIKLSLSQKTPVLINIYNVKGEKVRGLVDAELPAGEYQFEWNALDQNGDRVSGGIYFYKVKAGDNSGTKMTMITDAGLD